VGEGGQVLGRQAGLIEIRRNIHTAFHASPAGLLE
jgi:hypothetical protein